jgi:WD40 repeat protein
MLWNAEGHLISIKFQQAFAIKSLSFSACGRRLVSGSWENRGSPDNDTITFWNITNGSAIQTPKPDIDLMDSMAISTDDRQLAFGSLQGAILLWYLEPSALRHIE